MSRCPGKFGYASEAEAWQGAARQYENGHFSRDVQVYFCKEHGKWHLTTANVQLHDYFWHTKFPFRVANWFKQRGTIDQWDKE